ncbi:MAG: lysoplasmalogenase family protein [Jatrophihabitantaceae bacterium]
MAITFLILTGVAAAGDWAAVWQRLFRLEYLLKPLTLALLIAAAAAADLGAAKPWVLAALAFGLLGNVALMLSQDVPGRPDPAFLVGLASFLIGNAAYLVAFLRHGVHGLHLLAGLLIVAGAAVLTLPLVLRGSRRAGGMPLMAAVAAYAVLLGATAVLAVGTSAIATALGGLLLLASDAALGWDRFVKRLRRGPLLVIVSYHLAQLLIVIGLIRHR